MADELVGWALAAGVAYAAYKLIFGSSTRRQVSPEQIAQLTSMFPGVTDAAARWELERNGGSVERAVERALREGGLPEPPASYFPPSPAGTTSRPATPAAPAAPAAPTTAAATSAPATPPPSLIKRMGLSSRAAMEEKGKGKEVDSPASGWSPSAKEREERLKQRKERLVLEARRKLMEKERARKEAAAAGSSSPSS
ncbi:hypothetical protein JCM10213_007711 [Rhodosporidiobolus nylandii]